MRKRKPPRRRDTGHMPKHKVLKSVARSVADSFTSTLNWGDDDYVMGNLLEAARSAGQDTLHADLLTGRGNPPELMTPPVAASVRGSARWFPQLVESSGADMDFVTSAHMTIRFDTSIEQPLGRDRTILESPYTCSVKIEDDRGRVYESFVEGWWAPEPFPIKKRGIRSKLRRLLGSQ
jgi:hypothetical protein